MKLGGLGIERSSDWLGEGQYAECVKVRAITIDRDGMGFDLVDMVIR